MDLKQHLSASEHVKQRNDDPRVRRHAAMGLGKMGKEPRTIHFLDYQAYHEGKGVPLQLCPWSEVFRVKTRTSQTSMQRWTLLESRQAGSSRNNCQVCVDALCTALGCSVELPVVDSWPSNF